MNKLARRAAYVMVVLPLAVYSMLAGCDCTVHVYIENDATLTFRDGSHHGGGAVDAAVDDAAGDAGLPDADGLDAGGDDLVPDAAGLDAGADAGSADTCTPGPALQPFGFWSISADTLNETMTVTRKGLSEPGQTCNELKLEVLPDGNSAELCYRLPFGYEIPVEEGERVRILVNQNQGGECCLEQMVAIWDEAGRLRFFFYDGDPGYFLPTPCAETARCPMVGFADAACTPYDGTCGKTVAPPVTFTLGTDGTGMACEMVLQRGEVRLAPWAEGACSMRGKAILADSEKVLEMQCVDYPFARLGAVFIDSSVVSQCICRDHDDCAAGYLCETEIMRCVPNACATVRCAQGYACDPYTGQCLEPPAGVVWSCETTADCAAYGAGVCNTAVREFTGTGYCTSNWCEAMDCMAGLCSPLMNLCYECLSDCDCYVPGGPNGKCDTAARTCNPQ